MQNLSISRHYWQGNAAKSRVISDLLHRISGREVVVFDYGCGGAGDWPQILADNPNLRLYGYEPHSPSFRIAVDRLKGLRAEIFTGDCITSLSFKADYIVSFSVFEHVFDRRAFLAHASRLLASDGLFYLNYDDGHFRNLIDLAESSTWWGAVRVRLHNLLAVPLANLGKVSRFQQRVTSQDVIQLTGDAGFVIDDFEYHNFYGFKELFKVIDPKLQSEFSRFWIDIELELNSRFRSEMASVKNGDRVNLWSQMVSRTMWLRHSRANTDR
jgi:SAM-dependent methyltransferase